MRKASRSPSMPPMGGSGPLVLLWLALLSWGCGPATPTDRLQRWIPLGWRGTDLVVWRQVQVATEDVGALQCDSTGFYSLEARAHLPTPVEIGSGVCGLFSYSDRMSLSPDGDQVLFVANGRVVARLIGLGAVDSLTSRYEGARGRVAASSGGSLALSQAQDTGSVFRRIIVITAVGKRQRIDTIPEASDPSWSPDASRLVFSRVAVSGATPLVIATTGNLAGLRRLAVGGYPTWSPTGEWIAYFAVDSLEGAPIAVRLVHPDGTEDHQVYSLDAASGLGLLAPAIWSPDGARLILAHTGGVRELSIGSSSVRELLHNGQ